MMPDIQFVTALSRLEARIAMLEKIVATQADIIETHVKLLEKIQSDNGLIIFRIGQEIGALYKVLRDAREQGIPS